MIQEPTRYIVEYIIVITTVYVCDIIMIVLVKYGIIIEDGIISLLKRAHW